LQQVRAVGSLRKRVPTAFYVKGVCRCPTARALLLYSPILPQGTVQQHLVENFRTHNTDGFAALNVSTVFFCFITRRHPQLKEFEYSKQGVSASFVAFLSRYLRSLTHAGATRLFLCFFSAFATKLHAPVSRFFLSFRLVTKPRAGVSSLRFLYVISLLFLCSFFVFAAKLHARGCGFASLLSLCSFLVLSLLSSLVR
jgi:hypothetical protein